MALVTVGFLGFITLTELSPGSPALPRDQKAVGARLLTAIQQDGGGRDCTKIETINQSSMMGTKAVVYFVRCYSPSSKKGYRHFLVIRDPDWQNVTATPLNID
jgi:hypothetical protein